MEEQIKELRVEIDGLAQLCEGLKPIKDGAAIHNRLKGLELFNVYSTASERAIHKAKYEKEYDQVIKETSKNTNEIKEAVKSLKLSKSWLGKVLESLGSDNPYGSGFKTAEDIVPETDKVTGVPLTIQEAVDYNKMYHVEKVDWLRTEIKQIIGKCDNVIGNIDTSVIGIHKGDFIIQCDRFILQHLTEARFWLGFELGRIRDGSN